MCKEQPEIGPIIKTVQHEISFSLSINFNFAKKLYMKKVLFLLIFILLIAFAVYWSFFRKNDNNGVWTPKQEAIKTSKHSAAFYAQLDTILQNYFGIHDALVEEDSTLAKAKSAALIQSLGRLNMDDIRKDTSLIMDAVKIQVGNVQANAESLLKESDIKDIRQDFRMVSENLYPLLKTIHYDGKKLYWQNCPMAFGEGNDASWLSNTEEVYNPYLGKHHPTYKATMLHCGEIKDSITAQ